jgi:hypothetical protein
MASRKRKTALKVINIIGAPIILPVVMIWGGIKGAAFGVVKGSAKSTYNHCIYVYNI